jgi:hypothetical protein
MSSQNGHYALDGIMYSAGQRRSRVQSVVSVLAVDRLYITGRSEVAVSCHARDATWWSASTISERPFRIIVADHNLAYRLCSSTALAAS